MALNLNNPLIFLLTLHWILENGVKVSKVRYLINSETHVVKIPCQMYFVHVFDLTTIIGKYFSNLSIILIHYLLICKFQSVEYCFTDTGMPLWESFFKYISINEYSQSSTPKTGLNFLIKYYQPMMIFFASKMKNMNAKYLIPIGNFYHRLNFLMD